MSERSGPVRDEDAPRSSARLWDGTRRWVTAGSVALIFLAAMQALAVTTVMPVVSLDLDGARLYAVAFSSTLATAVIGMVATGAWADRTGPEAPLYVAVGLFLAGLVIAGLAPTMGWVVGGRLVQGLGVGGQTVALYVVVARVYPPFLHGRLFALFSAAWVVPSLVGPFAAGAVAEFVHWRWVFLGVAVLTLCAFAMVAVRLRGTDLGSSGPPDGPKAPVVRRLLCAAAASSAVLGLALAREIALPVWVVAPVCTVVAVLAIVPLLPEGTLRARRRLPSVVLTRGLIAGAFFGAEVYVPYLLIEEFAFSPSLAGLGLTTAAVAWAGAAWVQGRVGDSWPSRRSATVGCGLLIVSTTIVVLAVVSSLPAAVVIGGWTLAGAGMGILYPRLTVLTLAYSTPRDQGFHSAALSISDSIGSSVTIAVLGLVFLAAGGGQGAFALVFLGAGLVALAGLLPGLRMGEPTGSGSG